MHVETIDMNEAPVVGKKHMDDLDSGVFLIQQWSLGSAKTVGLMVPVVWFSMFLGVFPTNKVRGGEPSPMASPQNRVPCSSSTQFAVLWVPPGPPKTKNQSIKFIATPVPAVVLVTLFCSNLDVVPYPGTLIDNRFLYVRDVNLVWWGRWETGSVPTGLRPDPTPRHPTLHHSPGLSTFAVSYAACHWYGRGAGVQRSSRSSTPKTPRRAEKTTMESARGCELAMFCLVV